MKERKREKGELLYAIHKSMVQPASNEESRYARRDGEKFATDYNLTEK